jgi:Gas vesicle synthesis protein GvpO
VPGDDDAPTADRATEQASTRSGVSGVEAARRAVRRVYELTGLEPEGVTLLEPTDHGWRVGVEVVELERIPDSTDVLAIYQVELDEHARMVSYRRAQRHYRGRADGRGE